MLKIRIPCENLYLLKAWAREEQTSVTALVKKAVSRLLDKGIPDEPFRVMTTTTVNMSQDLQEGMEEISERTFIPVEEIVRRAVQTLIDEEGKSLTAEERLQLKEEALIMREERIVKNRIMSKATPERQKIKVAGSKALSELYGPQPKKKLPRL